MVVFLVFCVFQLQPLPAQGAADDPLTIAVSETRPYVFTDEAGQLSGALIDFWQLWSQKTGQPIQFELLPWNEAMAQVKSGEIQILGGVFYTPERDLQFDFSLSFFELRSTLFFCPPIQATGISSLDGLRVGVVKSDFHSDLLSKQAPNAIKVEFDLYEEVVQAALNQQVDAFLMEHVIGLHYLNQLDGIEKIRTAADSIDLLTLRSAVKDGDRGLLKMLDDGIEQISREELSRIIHRWTGEQKHQVTILAPNIPPVSFMKEGRLTGLGVEVVREILQRMGREDPIHIELWSEAFQRAQEEPNTALLPPSRTPAREKLFQWVGPLIPEMLYLFGRKEPYGSNLKALRTGAVSGYASERWLLDNGYQVIPFPDPAKGIQALVNGEIDLWINSNITMAHTAQKAGVDPELLQAVQAVKDLPAYLAFSLNTDAAVVRQWQRILDEIKLDGTFDRIVQEWVPLQSMSLTPQMASNGESGLHLSPEELAWIEKHPVIRVHNEKDWPPFNFYSEGRAQGYTIDLLNLLATKLGITIDYVTGPGWNEFLTMLQNREIDVMGNIVKTPDRSAYALFTEPIIKDPPAIFMRLDRQPVNSLAKLEQDGRSVAVVEGFYYQEFLAKQYPGIQVITKPNTLETIKAVAFGEVDATVGVAAAIEHLILETAISSVFVTGEAHFEGGDQFYDRIGVRKDWPLLRDIFQKAMQTVSLDEKRKLRETWLGGHQHGGDTLQVRVLLSEAEKAFLSQEDRITMCVDPDWMPFERINHVRRHEGIAADFVQMMATRLGVTIRLIQTRSWEESKEKFRQRQCDILSAAGYSDERAREMLFSKPYYKTATAIATRSEALFIQDASAVLDKSIGVVRGYSLVDRLRALDQEVDIIETDNIREGLEQLRDGRIYAFLDTIPAISYAAQEAGITGVKIAGQLDFSNEFHIAAHLDQTLLISVFNKAIDSLTDQDRRTITDRWAHVKIQHQIDHDLILKMVLAFVVISLIILYRHLTLSRLNRELSEANAKAMQATLAKSEFLAIMSHEIRTPMNAILGMGELLKETKLSDTQAWYVKTLNRSGETLLALINDILDLSKIEAGQLKLELVPFDLRKLIDETMALFALTAQDKGIELTAGVGEGIPKLVRGDPTRLRQVLLNLTGNAVKFTKQGRVTLQVDRATEDHLLFTVTDTGPGIPREKQQEIFRPFTQADSSITRSHGGTGLGLTICRRLADLMGGEIRLESSAGRGSSFLFTVPFSAVESSVTIPRADEAHPSAKGGETPDTSPDEMDLQILLVDDAEDNRLLIQAFLRKTRHRLVMAENGAEAVVHFKDQHFDLVLMDIQMPVMDGYEATRQIRTWEAQSHTNPTPIIALTAHAMAEESEQIMAAGCDLHITKPIRKKRLLAAITELTAG
ncbi:MAG: transporter substrate-binding domain-containing protein [Magnetococcales bacterium]|nr:transporter substrate-binding domain-containing protein [Magnetococcales bacterium]